MHHLRGTERKKKIWQKCSTFATKSGVNRCATKHQACQSGHLPKRSVVVWDLQHLIGEHLRSDRNTDLKGFTLQSGSGERTLMTADIVLYVDTSLYLPSLKLFKLNAIFLSGISVSEGPLKGLTSFKRYNQAKTGVFIEIKKRGQRQQKWYLEVQYMFTLCWLIQTSYNKWIQNFKNGVSCNPGKRAKGKSHIARVITCPVEEHQIDSNVCELLFHI